MKETNEYRITRPNMYPPNSPGHKDARARQGYYIRCDLPSEAFLKAARMFPGEDLDVIFWRKVEVPA